MVFFCRKFMKLKKLLKLAVLLFLVAIVIFFSYSEKINFNDFQKNNSVTVSIGKETLNLSIPSNTIFYDALLQAKNAGKIQFSGKNYTGLGFFITDIGSLHSGNGKNLLYYINGKEATVGVSSYTLKNGDIIEWKLE